jgi:hypothetical protein
METFFCLASPRRDLASSRRQSSRNLSTRPKGYRRQFQTAQLWARAAEAGLFASYLDLRRPAAPIKRFRSFKHLSIAIQVCLGHEHRSRSLETEPVAGRCELEPPTSAVIGVERSATEAVESHETAGVIRLEADPEVARQLSGTSRTNTRLRPPKNRTQVQWRNA